jgi:hypothetical protein
MNIQTLTSKMGTTPEFSMLSHEQLENIGNAVLNNKMIDAIGLYRDYTGMGLADAKAAVDRCFSLAVGAAEENKPITEPTTEQPKSGFDKVMAILYNKKLMGIITAGVCVVVILGVIVFSMLETSSAESNDNDYTYSSNYVSSNVNTSSNYGGIDYPTVDEYIAKLREDFPTSKIDVVLHNSEYYSFVLEDIIAVNCGLNPDGTIKMVVATVCNIDWASNTETTVKCMHTLNYVVYPLVNLASDKSYTYTEFSNDFEAAVNDPNRHTIKGEEDFSIYMEINSGTYNVYSDRASKSITCGYGFMK